MASWGERIKLLREARGLSQATVAVRLHLEPTDSRVSKYETGVYELTEAWVQRFAGALGVDLLEIIAPTATALDSAERELIEMYRGLSDDKRETVVRVVQAMPRSEEPPAARRQGSRH